MACPHAGRVATVDGGARDAMDAEAAEIAGEAVFNFDWEEISRQFDLIPVPAGLGREDAEAYRLERLLTHYGGLMSLQLANLLEMYAFLALFEDAGSLCRFLRCVAHTDTAGLDAEA